MLVISVFYAATENAAFDFGYYTRAHIPLLQRLWGGLGLQDVHLLKGTPGPDGSPPTYLLIALLTFESAEAFGAAATQHGAEIFADIANFTTISPMLQFNQPLG